MYPYRPCLNTKHGVLWPCPEETRLLFQLKWTILSISETNPASCIKASSKYCHNLETPEALWHTIMLNAWAYHLTSLQLYYMTLEAVVWGQDVSSITQPLESTVISTILVVGERDAKKSRPDLMEGCWGISHNQNACYRKQDFSRDLGIGTRNSIASLSLNLWLSHHSPHILTTIYKLFPWSWKYNYLWIQA